MTPKTHFLLLRGVKALLSLEIPMLEGLKKR